VISKPFKSEYDHEYGGGRLSADPRKSSTGRWYVPQLEGGLGQKGGVMESGVAGSVFYKRKFGKISGFYGG
jgi:hypothetical protein